MYKYIVGLFLLIHMFYYRAYNTINGYELQGFFLKADYMMERGPGSRSPRGGGRGNPKNMPFSGNQGSPLRASDFPLRYESIKLINMLITFGFLFLCFSRLKVDKYLTNFL